MNDVSRFSDVAAFKGLNIQLTFSCYLVKHGNDYLVWDTGNPAATGASPAPTAPKSSLVEQLAQLHLSLSRSPLSGSATITATMLGKWHPFPKQPC